MAETPLALRRTNNAVPTVSALWTMMRPSRYACSGDVFGPEDRLAKRIAVEEAGSGEKDCPQRDREGASARDQETCEQHRDRNHDLGTGKVDAVHVQRDADRRGNDEQQRQHEIESADADGHADRQQEGEVIRPDHGMPEAGEEALGEGRGHLAAHHMMGGGGRCHEEKRDHDSAQRGTADVSS